MTTHYRAPFKCETCSQRLQPDRFDDLPNGERNPHCRVCVGRHQSAALRRGAHRAGWEDRRKRQTPLLPSLTQRSIR